MLGTARCKEAECDKYPSFNYADKVSGIYCKTHMLSDMINVKAKRKYCNYPSCTTCATFNYENNKKGLYCGKHSLAGMIDVINKRCMFPKCTTHPSYNFSEEKTPLYCNAHKLDKMIDVVSKLCKGINCTYQPRFNYRGEKSAVYCSKHKLTGMINLVDHTCINTECSLLASFNYENTKVPIFCVKHKEKDMINVIEKKCKTYGCDIQIKEKYEGYCVRCFMYMFPDKPVSRNYKTKEQSVCEYLIKELPSFPLICDKRINGGESARRPDIFIDRSTYCIIVEIDENQHEKYDCSCENKRLMQLSADLKHKPIIFIRFNPDKYYNKDGKLCETSWKIDGYGILAVKNKTEWNERLAVLKNQVEYWINNPTDKMIQIVQLYYDQN